MIRYTEKCYNIIEQKYGLLKNLGNGPNIIILDYLRNNKDIYNKNKNIRINIIKKQIKIFYNLWNKIKIYIIQEDQNYIQDIRFMYKSLDEYCFFY